MVNKHKVVESLKKFISRPIDIVLLVLSLFLSTNSFVSMINLDGRIASNFIVFVFGMYLLLLAKYRFSKSYKIFSLFLMGGFSFFFQFSSIEFKPNRPYPFDNVVIFIFFLIVSLIFGRFKK